MNTIAAHRPGWGLPLSVLSMMLLAVLAGCGSGSTGGGPGDSTGVRDTTVSRDGLGESSLDEPRLVQLPDSPHPARTRPATNPSAVTRASYNEPADDSASPDEPGAKPKERAPFDPVRVNGKYFEGWPKPKLALVITGRQTGYLEPCGCSGLENQKGGLSRRHSLFNELAGRGWPVAAVDLGGLVRRFGKQAEFQFAVSADALKAMGYGAVGFGATDLRLSVGDVVAAVAGAKPEDSIFVSANVSLFGLTPKVRIFEVGGMKIGVTSVLGKEYQAQVNNNEVEIQDAQEALAEVVGELSGCDVRILLAQATRKETEALADRFPTFNLVVTADGADVPPARPERLRGGKTMLVEVGEKGQYAIVLGFFADKKAPLRYQRVALDSRFPNSDRMKQLMVDYQNQLQQLGWDGLGLKRPLVPGADPKDKLSGKFVGAANCKECHQEAYEVWAASKHAHATDTLVQLDPARHFDPECVSCHVTGWNPQEHYPFASGFESLERTPALVANSCENCHGPGGAHMAAERGKDANRQRAARESLKLSWPDAKESTCVKCHDHDNSPEFERNSDHYWEEIAH